MADIYDLAKDWLRLDQDPSTREEMEDLLHTSNTMELEKRLRNRISFGTAGLRARMGAGFSMMNALTVTQASQGFSAYLRAQDPSAAERGIVIGHDARHNSLEFAKLTAAAFLRAGVKVWWYSNLVHTPLVPFAVKTSHLAAGVMITASHNPAQDNGYKVYWSNGCQIIPPHDVGIAAAIALNLEPVSFDVQDSTFDRYREDALFCSIDHIIPKYFESIRVLVPRLSGPQVPFVYTSMHGVGLPYMTQAMEGLGYAINDSRGMLVVQEQALPDPDFPTVKFPNPEEKGALDLAISKADDCGISMVIANDPDADRLAVAQKTSHGWHQFSGNEVGILLASHMLDENAQRRPKLAMLSSAVSSAMLKAMASQEGVTYVETLTGFKWLGNRATSLMQQGFSTVYAFEEALGYMFSDVVNDKDAIAAGSVFLAATSKWFTKECLTPLEKLQQLYTRYGYFKDTNTYLISPDPATTDRVFRDIRSLDSPHPTTLGQYKIIRWRDLTVGYDSATSSHLPDLPVSPDSQMITCEVEGRIKFTIRGSGTEPKIKVYVECQATTSRAAKAGAEDVLRTLESEWFRPELYGLRMP